MTETRTTSDRMHKWRHFRERNQPPNARVSGGPILTVCIKCGGGPGDAGFDCKIDDDDRENYFLEQ